MSICIYSKKAFAFGPGSVKGVKGAKGELDIFTTTPNAFQDMPEKYMDDSTFKLALSCGDITIINGAKSENVADDSIVKDNIPMSEAEAFEADLKSKDKKSAIELGEEYNVTPQDGEKIRDFKARILEAYKAKNHED